MASLRTQLTGFWLLLLGVCVGLAFVMVVLYQNSAGVQIGQTTALTERLCESIATRYRQSSMNVTAEPKTDLMQVILRLALFETPHVEGGIWDTTAGFIAYAYPTYEGGGAKLDVPVAEQSHITEVARRAIHEQMTRTDILRGSREALILTSCPLSTSSPTAAVWIMTRVPAAAEVALRHLRAGLAGLLAAVLLSGAWLGTILTRAYRHVRAVEATLEHTAESQSGPPLRSTGVAELDRIISAVNRYSAGLHQAQAESRDLVRQQAHNQRLTALGRMVGSIAHEIRNPIATMRLKAENALVGSPERHSEALTGMLQQIERLDRLVQNLLATVQPLQLRLVPVSLHTWISERKDEFLHKAAAKDIRLFLESRVDTAVFDPMQMARALDNLLENAIRHAPADSEVHLTVERAGSTTLVFRVTDQGEGVALEFRDHLFEPFATSRAEGTGLGLALVREIAVAHGGDIRYLPQPHGSSFELEIPWRAS